MARRGEGQFVAVPVGLVHDVKVRGLARTLRISRLEAAMHVVLWEEFILTHGEVVQRGRDRGQGVVRGHTGAELAEALEWPLGRRPSLIIGALKGAQMLRCRRGAWIHPFWADTITGEYALRRAKGRDYDKKRRGKPDADGTPNGVRSGSDTHPTGRRPDLGDQPTNGSGGRAAGAPQGAPPGGAADRASRWDWFETTYPIGIEDRDGCADMLAQLDPQDFEHLQFALPAQVSSNRWKHTLWRVPPAHRYLKQRQWRRIKWKPGQKPPVKLLKVVAIESEPKPDAAELERQRAVWARHVEIRTKLKKEGLRDRDLEDAIRRELERTVS